jgi:hypothetical protein
MTTQYPHIEPERFMKSPGVDTLLGFLLGSALLIVFGIGILADPILYFVYRGKLPAFARGIGLALLIWVGLILGALVLCIGSAYVITAVSK